jgi:hypothetical protein
MKHIFLGCFKVGSELLLIAAILMVFQGYHKYWTPFYFEDELANTKHCLHKMGVPDSKVNELAIAFHNASRVTGVDEDLIMALSYTEAEYNKFARSKLGYKGLMQIPEDLWDPDLNVLRGVKILQEKMAESKGNLRIALVLYKGFKVGSADGDARVNLVFHYQKRLQQIRKGTI